MKKPILTLAVLAGIFLTTSAEAQLLKKIQNAAQNATQSSQTQKTESSGAGMGGLLGGIMDPADTEEMYEFSGYMVVEIISTDKKGKASEPSKMNYLMGSEKAFMGMSFSEPKNPENTTTTIMDTKNHAMVILMENKGDKTSMALNVNYDEIQGEVDNVADQEMNKATITKTGRTKKILGYDCSEFEVKTDDGSGVYWVTDQPIEGINMFSPQSSPVVSKKTVEKYETFFKNAPKGTFLETTFTSSDGSITQMNVIEIQKNSPKSFVMSEYPNAMATN